MTHPLSLLVFVPAIAGLLLLLVPDAQGKAVKGLAFAVALGLFVFGLVQLLPLRDAAGIMLAERHPWLTISGLPVEYHLALDGLSFWLVLLTLFLTPLTMLGTWNSLAEKEGRFNALFLLLQSGMLGALLAQDLLFFYLFWEAMLIPMYFMIGVWGGDDRRYAATKFFLFTLSGSLLWLVALLYLAGKAGSFSAPLMAQAVQALPFAAQCWLFLAFAAAFAIKVPLFPLHTWLPDAHTQAPTAGSVILAGVLLKLGGYGFLRFAVPIFPEAALHYAKPIALLSVIAIIYGALVAMVQRDIKKLVAYSSVSHMGFVMLGIASFTHIGTQGAVLQMLNHGISTGSLFLLVGMLYDRAHTRMIADFGGVASKMPIFTGFFLVVTLSAIGLPLTNGFVGEFLILNGTWTSGAGAWVQAHVMTASECVATAFPDPAGAWGQTYAGFATLGVLLGAAYMLWMVKRVFWGPENADEESGTHHLHDDLGFREIFVMVPMVVLIFWMGLRPNHFMAASDKPVAKMLADAKAPAPNVTPIAVRPGHEGSGAAVHEAPSHGEVHP